jgi:hypothetical protein
MKVLITTAAVVPIGAVTATMGLAPSAKQIRGAWPYIAVSNEPAPRLIVDEPRPEGLTQGVFWAQYRVENLRILPIFGPSTLQVSPRVGHLYVMVDDPPWCWADASDSDTVDIAGLPPGPHTVRISLVDSNTTSSPDRGDDEIRHTRIRGAENALTRPARQPKCPTARGDRP